ncbi:MAG: thiamine diphosphokinase [Holosporaceae bacterium]|jgi:thiamine pyrophosphokinase|nr:thiamine diphosphokinase [Holosporaceae bacterium]
MIKILGTPPAYRSALCLDGNLEYEIIKRIGLPIVAADGAANTLVKNGIEPSIIIGDLDSVNVDLLKDVKYIRDENQENTDFEKALDYIADESLSPAIVFGIDGGYIDHILGNIAIFSRTKFAAVSKDMIFLVMDDNPGHRSFQVEVGAKISIFGMPRCVIKSRGLKWELNHDELSIEGRNSNSNRAVSDTVELELFAGKALIFFYTKEIRDAGIQ